MIDKSPTVRVGMNVPLNKLARKPRDVVTVRIKNRGPNPRIIYDTSLKAIRLGVGQVKAVEIGKGYAKRIQAQSLRDGSLVVLDASAIDGGAEPVVRVRIKGKGADTATKVPSSTSKRAPKSKAKFGSASKSSGKPAKETRKVIRPEITTASQLLAAMSDGDPLAYNHFKSVAFRVLPAGTLANGANKAAIEAALRKAARAE